jgi:hypothetical protein
MLTDTDSEQAEFKKKAPDGKLQPYGGKAQSQPPADVDILLPLRAESSSTMQRQKVKKWTPAVARDSVSSIM